MPANKNLRNLFFLLLCLAAATGFSSCYSFSGATIDPNVKTVRVNLIENRASYVNPQLSPTLTDRLRQRIVNQTRLSQTNSDNAHFDISGTITSYSVSTSGISNQRVATNSLNVGVNIVLYNQLDGTTKEFPISRSFPFAASLSLQAAEAQLLDEIIRNLTDDIFNRIFSNW